MSDAPKYPIAATQTGLLIGYSLRVRRFVPVALILALVAGGLVEAYRRATVATVYVSETVAIVRPQAAFRSTPQSTVVNYLNNPDRDAEFLPKPLSVVDYELLVKTHDVLAAVAAAYNEEHGGNVTVGTLRGYLQAVTKLELRTPYEVRYYPTMQLRVQAPDAALANELASIWAEKAGTFCEELTRQVKAKTLEYVNEEYEATLKKVGDGMGPHLPENLQSLDRQLLLKRAERLSEIQTEAKLASANEVPEFMIVSAPTPAVAQVRGWPRWAAGVAFVLTAMVLIAAAMLWCAIADVRAAMDEQSPAKA